MSKPKPAKKVVRQLGVPPKGGQPMSLGKPSGTPFDVAKGGLFNTPKRPK
jgi:hypothetical protein